MPVFVVCHFTVINVASPTADPVLQVRVGRRGQAEGHLCGAAQAQGAAQQEDQEAGGTGSGSCPGSGPGGANPGAGGGSGGSCGSAGAAATGGGARTAAEPDSVPHQPAGGDQRDDAADALQPVSTAAAVRLPSPPSRQSDVLVDWE